MSSVGPGGRETQKEAGNLEAAAFLAALIKMDISAGIFDLSRVEVGKGDLARLSGQYDAGLGVALNEYREKGYPQFFADVIRLLKTGIRLNEEDRQKIIFAIRDCGLEISEDASLAELQEAAEIACLKFSRNRIGEVCCSREC